MRGVLLDGFACATWRTERSRGRSRLEIEPFEPLRREDREAIAEEGERLLRFLAEPRGTGELEVLFSGEKT
jgi:hypothetical protein